MNVVIINQFNSDNIGDKLIGQVLYDFFADKGVSISLAGFAQTEFQEIKNQDDKYEIFEWLKNICPAIIKFLVRYKKNIRQEVNRVDLKKADALVIGGGQLLKHGGLFPYCFYEWCKYAFDLKIPIYIYGVGVDHDLNIFDRMLYFNGLKKAKYISCRDLDSSRIISKLIGQTVDTYPDVVFSKDIVKSNSNGRDLVVMPYNYMVAKRHFSSLKSRDNYYGCLLNIINSSIHEKIVLTATTSSDYIECLNFAKYLDKKKVKYVIKLVTSESELEKIYDYASVVCSGRMHAMILSMLRCIKTKPLMISHKITTFSKEYLQSGLDVRYINNESKKGMEILFSKMVER